MAQQLVPLYQTLSQLFVNRVFRIPKYQRFYSWGKKQREDLFSDIKRLYDEDRNGDSHHFMATIVCSKVDGKSAKIGDSAYRKYDIVDGQQRLTTIILLLKSIELKMGEHEKYREKLHDILVKPDNDLILLQTNNVNQNMFEAYLRDGTVPEADEVKTHADKNLKDAIVECQGFVDDWVDDWDGKKRKLLDLSSLIQNRLGFVIFDTQDNKGVYTIFEVLNSRGMTVDWLDKCKCMLMGKAYELLKTPKSKAETIESLHNIWAQIYNEIATENVAGEEILRTTAILFYDAKIWSKSEAAGLAVDIFEESCKTGDDPRRISENIRKIAKEIMRIHKDPLEKYVAKVQQARTLNIAIRLSPNLSPEERRNALRQWERTSFRIFGLARLDAREMREQFMLLASRIVKKKSSLSYSEIMREIRNLGNRNTTIDKAVRIGLKERDDIDKDHELCRYILWRYEKFLAREDGDDDADKSAHQKVWSQRAKDSIEHIFPQRPRPHGRWDEEGDVQSGDYEQYVGKIGNLSLLTQKQNLNASNHPFAKKKEIYEKSNLRLYKKICKKLKWRLSDIQKRTNEIIKWAQEEWSDVLD